MSLYLPDCLLVRRYGRFPSSSSGRLFLDFSGVYINSSGGSGPMNTNISALDSSPFPPSFPPSFLSPSLWLLLYESPETSRDLRTVWLMRTRWTDPDLTVSVLCGNRGRRLVAVKLTPSSDRPAQSEELKNRKWCHSGSLRRSH